MINYLKSITLITLLLIRYNIFKVLYILLIIISYNSMDNYPDELRSDKVVSDIIVGKKHLYITESIDDNEIDYDIEQLDKSKYLKNGRLYEYTMSNYKFTWGAIFFLSIIFIIGALFIGLNDDDFSWGYSQCVKKSILLVVKTEFDADNGIYYYMIFDRLIGKRDRQIAKSNVLYEFGIDRFSDVFFCPVFKKTFK